MVYVTAPLDYEQKQYHQLPLQATETKKDGNSDSTLFVNVKDVNNCSPKFVQENYSIKVSEALPLGSTILDVKARDQDTGDNQNIEYSIKSASSSNDSDVFSINRLSGEISLKRSLDHERQVMHNFIVTATIKDLYLTQGRQWYWSM